MYASSRRLQWRLTLIVMVVFALLSSGCSPFPSQPATLTPPQRVTESPPVVSPKPVPATTPPVTPTPLAALTDPASLYCIEKGGRLEIRSSGNSSHIGVCILDDGTLCEQWSFYRGECQSDQTYNLPPAPPLADDKVFAALFADVRRRLPPEAFTDFAAQPMRSDDGRQWWVVYSLDMRNFGLDERAAHFVAIYSYDDNRWQERARVTLVKQQTGVNLEPAYLEEVRQVAIAPGKLWIQVEGGLGLHSGSYHLLSFDGVTLQPEVVAFSSSPNVGYVTDLNGDGLNEVVLRRFEYYIFCYACEVYYPFYEVYTWQNDDMVLLAISDLTAGYQGSPFAELNRKAVAFAQADLWAEALRAINDAVAQAGATDPPTTAGSLRWNQRLIRMIHDAHREAIETSAYPLINEVFYGDYARAVEHMRAYQAADLFRIDSPLIVGTVAEGWTENLGEYLVNHTGRALAVVPDRAEIYFVGAWGKFLVNPDDPAIGADLERAARLQPNDQFFADAFAWWQDR